MLKKREAQIQFFPQITSVLFKAQCFPRRKLKKWIHWYKSGVAQICIFLFSFISSPAVCLWGNKDNFYTLKNQISRSRSSASNEQHSAVFISAIATPSRSSWLQLRTIRKMDNQVIQGSAATVKKRSWWKRFACYSNRHSRKYYIYFCGGTVLIKLLRLQKKTCS